MEKEKKEKPKAPDEGGLLRKRRFDGVSMTR